MHQEDHDYEYDIFISYSHQMAVKDWVFNEYSFYDLLKKWLQDQLGRDPNIFIDRDGITPGDAWPERLQRSLKQSRCLLAIWSPSYFQSEWCESEFYSFREREKRLGLRTVQSPSGLIYPVLFSTNSDAERRMKKEKIQYSDLSAWNYTSPGFKDTKDHVNFEKYMRDKVSQELTTLIQQAPVWQQDWPIKIIKKVKPAQRTVITQPRLQ